MKQKGRRHDLPALFYTVADVNYAVFREPRKILSGVTALKNSLLGD
jgi:hypothetical protein